MFPKHQHTTFYFIAPLTFLAALLHRALVVPAQLVQLVHDGGVAVRAGEASAHGLAALVPLADTIVALDILGVLERGVAVRAADGVAEGPLVLCVRREAGETRWRHERKRERTGAR